MIETTMIVGLAGWRLAALLTYERGPLRVFEKLRSLIGVTHDDQGEPQSWPDGLLGSLFSCVWCMSVWTSLGMWVLWQWHPEPVIILAAAAVAVAAEKWCHG